jgi:plasmid stabilization system protein ParE
MARVVVSSPANADSNEVLAYLARVAGPATADKYDALFTEVYERLAVDPDMYAVRPALGPKVRAAVVRPYLVIYEHTSQDVVNILRILHGSRRIRRSLLSG